MINNDNEKRHFWLISYQFKGGNGFLYVDSKDQYISPATIEDAIDFAISKDKNIKKAMPMCVSYLGFMTAEEAKSL